MSRIQKLDTQTANMIAAGEVVERPRGVVKELVENAMDAGATRIMISYSEGGLKKIVVEDNGMGMDHTDARACFERHATSKIHKESDLWNIHTMGFRGEALPSIAAAAKVTLLTGDGSDGTKVIMAYGRQEAYEDAPAPQGTSITVEDLFYETPARLKHMRSASYEGSLITSLVQTFALGAPDIAFRLYSENREVFRTSGNGDLAEVLYQVYGRSAAENAIPLDFSDYDYHVRGALIKPIISRASRYGLHIFLNGRMVHERKLDQAVEDGYRGFLKEGRYPLAVIDVQMDPHIIDVNVHPSKWEVRLSKEKQLEYLLQDQIASILSEAMKIPEEKMEQKEVKPVYFTPLSFSEEEMRPLQVKAEAPAYEDRKITLADEKKQDEAVLQKVVSVQEEKAAAPGVEAETDEEEEKVPLPVYQVIGQYRKKYVLCACGQGLMMVDLRRCEVRLTYEKCLREMKESHQRTDLLVPLTMHFTPDECDRVEELNQAFADTGIVYEPFGTDTLLVRSIPLWLQGMHDHEKILQDLAEMYLQEDRKINVQEEAAKEAVKYMPYEEKTLSMDEMKQKLAELSGCANAWTDPYGRAIVVLLDEKEIERRFG